MRGHKDDAGGLGGCLPDAAPPGRGTPAPRTYGTRTQTQAWPAVTNEAGYSVGDLRLHDTRLGTGGERQSQRQVLSASRNLLRRHTEDNIGEGASERARKTATRGGRPV